MHDISSTYAVSETDHAQMIEGKMMGEEGIDKRGLWGEATCAVRSRLGSIALFPTYHSARNHSAFCGEGGVSLPISVIRSGGLRAVARELALDSLPTGRVG